MAHDPTLRAKLSSQLEALETTARLARVREQSGRHAEPMELASVGFHLDVQTKRIVDLVCAILETEP